MAKLQAQFNALGKQMAASRTGAPLTDNVSNYQKQLAQINALRDGHTKLQQIGGQTVKTLVPGFNQLMQATEGFTVQTVKSVSATTSMTKAIMDQKVSITSAMRNWGQFKETLRGVAREQDALRKASAMQWKTNSNGKNTTDMYVPNNLAPELLSARAKYGTILSTLQAMGTATQNWGKNTQWAGRQITAGFTMPLAMAAAGLAKLAYDADKQMTRITKVYDTKSQTIQDADVREIAMAKELDDVRTRSMANANKMAKEYGANVADTLSMEADLAAIGKTGNELMQSTAEVTRIATLGELDLHDAMMMTVTMLSTYKMSAKELGDSFNYMNAIENATSLTTQDFADAIPRAAASMNSLGVTFQQFGTLMVALKEGGVSADQGANALKSATGRLLSPTKEAKAAFDAMGISIESVVKSAGGNLYNVLKTLAPQMQGFDDIQQQSAIKALFGTYQYNRLNIVLQNLGAASAGLGTEFSQTAKAIDIANQSTKEWAATADREIKQFQTSSSGRLKIAAATLKADLTEMGAPILSALSPVVHALNTLVNIATNLPGPIKTMFKTLAIGMAITGPVMMFVGILTNWFGTIMKVAGGIGKLVTGFGLLTPEMAADEALTKTSLQTKDKAAQASATLALRMQELLVIMKDRLAVQEALNAATVAGTSAETASTAATLKDAAADATSAAAMSRKEAAQLKLNAAALGTSGKVPFQGTPNGLYQATSTQRTRDQYYNMLAAQHQGQPFSSTSGNSPFAVGRDGAVNVGGVPGGVVGSRKAAERFFAAQSMFIENGYKMMADTTAGARGKFLGSASDYHMQAARAANQGGFLPMSAYVGGSGDVVNRMTSLPAVPPAAAAASERAAKNSADVAANAEKTSANWGRIAGNMGGLAVGAMMMKGMADGSGDLLGNLLQGTLAVTMLLPVVASAVNGMKALSASAAAARAGGAAQATAMGALWGKAKTAGTGALSALKGGATWLFTTGPGIFVGLLTAAGVAAYGLNEYFQRTSERQKEINKSTEAWAGILGYTRKTMADIEGGGNKNVTAYKARSEAVKKLSEENEGLAQALTAAAEAGDNYNSVFNMAVTEALKARVDGATAEEARMAFNVALQTAGLGQGEIHNLQLKFDSVNLDDPQGIAKAINDQISAALNHSAGDGFALSGGWDRTLFNTVAFGGSLTGTDGYLGDDATAMFSNVGNQVYTAIANGLQNGDKSQIDSAMDSLASGLDKTFAESFGDIRSSSPEVARVFKEMGISSMTQLRNAMVDAAAANSKGTASKVQKSLLGLNLQDNSQYKEFYQGFKTVLISIAESSGLSGKALDNFKDKIDTTGELGKFFTDGMEDAADATEKVGSKAQQAADGVLTMADAMSTAGAIASGSQYASTMKSTYSATVNDYVEEVNRGMDKAHQATVDGIQAAGEARQKGFEKSLDDVKANYDAQEKAIDKHYKSLSDGYEADIKRAKDGADAKVDAINKQIDAIGKEDDARQELFDNEKTRIQRMAELQNNNIDFNSALASGNLDEAAKIYTNTGATVQQWGYDDQEKAMDKASEAKKDALSAQIEKIEKDRDAYIEAIEKKKDALSDLEQAEKDSLKARQKAEEDALNASKEADRDRTAASVKASNDRYEADKRSIDRQVAAITAAVPQSVGQVYTQISQINTAYGDYGTVLKLQGDKWGAYVGDALSYNVGKEMAALQNEIGWSQIGDFIQQQIDSGAAFTVEQAAEFLKTGKWPEDIGGTAGNAAKAAAAWKAKPAPKWNSDKTELHFAGGGKSTAFHSGGQFDMREIGQKDRKGYPHGSAPFRSEYLTLLEQGEFVVNKDATAKNLELLKTINGGNPLPDGDMAARHSGGLATGIMTRTMIGRAAVMQQAAKQAINNAMLSSMTAGLLGNATFIPVPGGPAVIGTGRSQIDRMWNTVKNAFPGAKLNSSYRPGDPGYHGRGKAIDIGKAGVAGGAGNAYMAAINRWIHDKFPGSTELIYDGLGDDRPDLKNGQAHTYNAATRAQHTNHVHWAQQAFHNGGLLGALPGLRTGGTIQYDNTLANLHKDETVLTAPLTKAFQENVANGFGNEYNVEVNFHGPVASNIDVKKAVIQAIEEIEDKNGRGRVIK